ncbi:glycoside hydrolase family 127 protein [Emticicia sp. CRIBPO]|uniref:glycoside hydrolase family 127 protein n=1 Tax=Emticicia sp. CRIBPO TaxID=2683258 RepID=UPI001E2BC1E4|nr:glycoside hydrolase family 127 protein [Emticicia sp. CRIBPO]
MKSLKAKLLPIILFIVLGVRASAQMQTFGLQEVRLTAGNFKNAGEVDRKYILALNPDRLLAPYLIDAGLPVRSNRYGNWESIGLDGHIGGHYLSALSMMYASTGDAELKRRLDYMVGELARCQEKNGNGYVGGIPQGKVFWERIRKGDIDGSSFGLNNTWVPLYNIHKLFAGLHDAWQYTGNQQARTVLIGLGNWFNDLIEPLSQDQIQQVLRTEHGGMNEVFADLYVLTRDKKFLDAAQKLSHKAILEPLLLKQDRLTGLHANTQIPKVIGFEKTALLTGNKAWSEAARYFWYNVSHTRSVAFGGNSVREHFNPVNDFGQMIKSNQGPETCNSYNMLRLTRALFLDNNDVSYLDYYERTLYNHILSSQHPEKGGFVYFTPIRPNHYRVYSQPETSMWCCVGSGIENHAKYGELIYSHSSEDIFVNLFIPSVLNWKDKGVQLTQKTDFPYKNETEIVLSLKKAKTFTFNIRRPEWAESFEIFVNGKIQAIESKPSSYIPLHRKWKTGDTISIRFKTTTRLEYLPDKSNWAAFVHGPIVLAAKTSVKNLDGLFADDSRMGHEAGGRLYPLNEAHALVGKPSSYVSRLDPSGPLQFRLDSLTLQPFFEIHEARYQMYFQTYSPEEYQARKAALKQEEAAALALESRTLDKVNCGEQQPEVDHLYRGEKSVSGSDEGLFWRMTRSYIAYQFRNKNQEGKWMEISVLDNLKPDAIKVEINGGPADIILSADKMIRIKIEGMEVIDLKITALNGSVSPRFHQIRILKN